MPSKQVYVYAIMMKSSQTIYLFYSQFCVTSKRPKIDKKQKCHLLQTCLQFVYSMAVKVMCFLGIVRPKTF